MTSKAPVESQHQNSPLGYSLQAVRAGDVQTFQQEVDANMHTFCVQVCSAPVNFLPSTVLLWHLIIFQAYTSCHIFIPRRV